MGIDVLEAKRRGLSVQQAERFEARLKERGAEELSEDESEPLRWQTSLEFPK